MSVLHEQSRTVGQRIAAARQRAGLSIRDLADRIGWPRDTLVNYELGRRAITIERLDQIADALGICAAALLIKDEQLAALLTRLASSPALLAHVRFFVDTLDDDIPSDPTGRA
ncbi:MAG: helix-turn-helix transcriptional regulator [Oscillochloris sp.]|nr:helix-turn-helix transcriptional regulator [Oscillochloris sp.]